MPIAAAAAVAACPSPVGLARPLCGAYPHQRRRRGFRLEASSSASAPAPAAADEGAGAGPCPVVRFDMDNFAIADRVSVGLHGRSDEMIFEATVRDPSSELYGSTVVLRQLKSSQAKRRGRRALEVLKKLARRQVMYHSYALQVHGYIAPGNAVEQEDVPLVLVHGYHGSYSLRHWLQLSDWLPTLEATLALDEEQVRRVGDDSVGGPALTRQLRLIRILMRDLLIGVNYLHSHGLAHTELRLENVHVSPIDKHVKKLEVEELEKAPKFKAKPLNEKILESKGYIENDRKPLTKVQQFALHVDDRAVQGSEFYNMIKEKEKTYKRLREENEFAQKTMHMELHNIEVALQKFQDL